MTSSVSDPKLSRAAPHFSKARGAVPSSATTAARRQAQQRRARVPRHKIYTTAHALPAWQRLQPAMAKTPAKAARPVRTRKAAAAATEKAAPTPARKAATGAKKQTAGTGRAGGRSSAASAAVGAEAPAVRGS